MSFFPPPSSVFSYNNIYDVFLSSGGYDTAKFRSELNSALVRGGLNTYFSQVRNEYLRKIDERIEEQKRIEEQEAKKELERINAYIEQNGIGGIPSFIESYKHKPRYGLGLGWLFGGDRDRSYSKEIACSKISTVIFSKEYSCSTWCLDELIKIIECKDKLEQIVLPVFYDVDPSDVRNQTGPFQEAFAKHEKLEDPEKVKRWRAALKVVAELSEFHTNNRPDSELIQGFRSSIWPAVVKGVANLFRFQSNNRPDSELIQEIVEDIKCKLSTPLSISSNKLGRMDLLLGKLSLHIGLGLDDVRAVDLNPYLPSPSSNPNLKYDVFLSFRGEDTRNSFTSQLYSTLKREGFRTFMVDSLEKGEKIGPELMKAIEGSRSSIVILSKEYASSTWCLDELVKIVECKDKLGQKVVPVFYGVDQSDVREQTGSFQEAFAEHEKHENLEKVKRWREVLRVVANVHGFRLNKRILGLDYLYPMSTVEKLEHLVDSDHRSSIPEDKDKLPKKKLKLPKKKPRTLIPLVFNGRSPGELPWEGPIGSLLPNCPDESFAKEIAQIFVNRYAANHDKEEEEEEEEESSDDFPDPDDSDFGQRIAELAVEYYNRHQNKNLKFVKVLEMSRVVSTLFYITFDARDLNGQVKAYIGSVEKLEGYYPMVHSCQEKPTPPVLGPPSEIFWYKGL